MKVTKVYILFCFVFVFPLQGFSKNSTELINTKPLTEEEDFQSRSYIHQGIANEKARADCGSKKDGYENICSEDKFALKGNWQSLEAVQPHLLKAYALFSGKSLHSGGGGLGGFTAKSLDKEGKQIYQLKDGTTEGVKLGDKGATAKTEKKRDWCSIVAIASEAAQQGYMLIKGSQIEENFKSSSPEASQAASFNALSDTHDANATASDIQFGVWSATAACYVAYLSQAAFQGDWKVSAKLTASTFIAWYYQRKASAHRDRRDILKKMASDLPQAGDCNPFTQKSCFCTEESSFTSDPGNFNRICLPEILRKRNKAAKNDAFICVNQNAKPDPKCDCERTNSCIDKALKIAGINLGLGATVLKDPLRSLKPLSKGFGAAGVNSASNRNFALAKRTLKKVKPLKGTRLNTPQKAIAKGLFKNGIPKGAAILLASVKTPKGSSLPSSVKSGFSNKRFQRSKQLASKKSKFNKGRAKSRSRKRGSKFNRFNGRKKASKSSGVNIESFAQKAQRKAEIVSDSSRPIFDIITYRYRASAWPKFIDQ